MLGLEHVLGVYSTSFTQEVPASSVDNFEIPGGKTTTSSTRFSVLGVDDPGLFTSPKLALDVAASPPLTLGGSFFFYTTSSSTEVELGGSTEDGNEESTVSGFGINPRIGVALNDEPIFWLRAGIAYASRTTTYTSTIPSEVGERQFEFETTLSATALSLEAILFYMPEERGFGFGVGPAVYIPVSTSYEAKVSGDGDLNGNGNGSDSETEYSVMSWLIAASGYFGF
jgi:hypothetical protein